MVVKRMVRVPGRERRRARLARRQDAADGLRALMELIAGGVKVGQRQLDGNYCGVSAQIVRDEKCLAV